MKEGTTELPDDSPAAKPGEELTGKDGEGVHVLDGMLPTVVTFEADS